MNDKECMVFLTSSSSFLHPDLKNTTEYLCGKMIYRFSLLQAPFGLLVFLILLHPIPARVPIEPLSEDQLFNSFNLYPINGPGGCGRYAPNGVPMMPFVLKSLGGANAIVQTVLQDLPTYPTQIYVRGLLFLFFGITFLADHQINPIAREGNENAYNNILRRAKMDLFQYQYLLLMTFQTISLRSARYLSAHKIENPDTGAWKIMLPTTSIMSVPMAGKIRQHP